MGRKKAVIYSDGSCYGNPGRGGYGCIVKQGKNRTVLTGSVKRTTNNQIELTAAIRGLEIVRPNSTVELCSDSQYVVNGITTGLDRWKLNGWKRRTGESITNKSLWQAYSDLVELKV